MKRPPGPAAADATDVGRSPDAAYGADAADAPAGASTDFAANDSALDTGWAETAAREAAPEGSASAAGGTSALARISRTYAAARAAIGATLAVGVGVTSLAGLRPPGALLAVCLAYALQSVLWWLMPRLRAAVEVRAADAGMRMRRQWLATVGVDLAAFGALHVLASDASVNFAALLVLPVLMSGVLSPRLVALGTAAAATLLLLVVAWVADRSGTSGALPITQSGLAGIGFFAIALVAAELASRLAREQRAARGSLELARQQARLNRLVIEEMVDGVLVVDRELRVRAINPAARALLAVRGEGPKPPFVLGSRPEWHALADVVKRARADARWPEAGEEVPLDFGAAGRRMLRVRVKFTRRRSGRAAVGEELCVLLLEDDRTAQHRLRQDKLAAMGRMSAGIAHEIRNPLAAIAQANALLLEDPLPEPQRRLARMVAENVERLRRIVDDVLEVAPGAAGAGAVTDATAEVAEAAAQWARTAGVDVGPGGRLKLDLPRRALPVRFEREHLRRVLVNLLDNANRHCSGGAGAVGLRLAVRDDATALLLVDSDGLPIPADVERHLFEPFFSTRSRGTGLGLYICRELCERYGASIEYRPRPDLQRNLFLVIMRREAALPGVPSPEAAA